MYILFQCIWLHSIVISASEFCLSDSGYRAKDPTFTVLAVTRPYNGRKLKRHAGSDYPIDLLYTV